MNEECYPFYIDPWKGWKRVNLACDITGLTRAWLYPRMKDGRIRTGVLKDDDKGRGIRMVHMPSLKAYIENNLEETVPTGISTP